MRVVPFGGKKGTSWIKKGTSIKGIDWNWEQDKNRQAEFMQDKIGEEYVGIISSITQFGMFVELESTVEGLIRFENMGNEYYIYDENKKILIGERTNRIFKIGDKVKVRVIEANKQLRKINFELLDEEK